MRNRVKFYSADDLSIRHYLPQVKEILDNFINDPNIIPSCIGEAIEFQNVEKYIVTNTFSREWGSEYIEKVRNVKDSIEKSASRYLGSVSGEDVQIAMNSLDYTYYEDLFFNFKKFCYGKKIPEMKFEESFLSANIPVRYLLKTSYIGKTYPVFLKNFLLKDSLTIELLLSNYSDNLSEKLIFPKNITKNEWEALFDSYIDNPKSNINYLRMLEGPIKKFDYAKYFNVLPKQRLRIKERQNNFRESVGNENSGLVANIIVYSNRKDYENEMSEAKLNNEMSPKKAISRSIMSNIIASTNKTPFEQFSYTLRGLVDNEQITEAHGFLDLFNYIKDEYDFFSDKLISKLPSYPNDEMGALTKNIGIKTDNFYIYDGHFETKQQLAFLKIKAISKFIGEWDIRIEDIIEWYFISYCKKKYNVSWIAFDVPHTDETVGNKTSTLFRIEENIRTQYIIFSEEGVIAKELVNETSTPSIMQLQSLLKKKYAYLSKNEKAEFVLHHLFSDQSGICYISEKLKGEEFAVLISNNDVRISDFIDHQKEVLQHLIDINIIQDKDEILKFTNINKIELLRDIYLYGVTSFIHASPEDKVFLDELEEEGFIVFDKSLFTKQESDYLNFILNNKIFDNSWAIRNKYQHGVPYYENGEQYELDNAYALLVLIHYMVKIDDELNLTNDCRE